jgi:hypothetical protein
MRNSREKWTFFQHPSKPIISANEVNYWKRQLKSILKVGLEFEFNLPNKNGNCKGDSQSCPCATMNESDCWTGCDNKTTCLETKDMSRCGNQKKACKPESCNECEDYKPVCNGIFCPGFVPKCYTCEKFATNCKACPDRFDPDKNPESIRSRIINELSPNNCYGLINKSGVHSITTDGSLLGKKGAEVITIGRRIDFWEFYKMSKEIIDTAASKGAYVNERCSIHMHVLAAYYSKLFQNGDGIGVPNQISELEKPLPEIILANFHQLVRRFQNALTWMTMGLDDPNKMTRWEKFRVSVLEISAIMNSMMHVREEVSRNAGGNKYGFVNYKFCNFDDDGNISRFHIEMRQTDGILSPTIVAALACLHYAMVIKAVEISKYGVVEVGDSDWMEYATRAKQAILNNMKGYQDGDRFGDTRNISKFYDYYIGESLELVRQLKHILIQIGPAYQVLEQLAERPVALRRCDGHNWERIEKDFAVPISEEGKLEHTLSEFIDLRLIDSCKTVEEWIKVVSEALRAESGIELGNQEEVEKRVNDYVIEKRNDGKIIWSESLGSIVSL